MEAKEQTKVPRTLPELEKHTEAFWTGGQCGQLMINQCSACQHYIHPPVPMCPLCHSRDVTATPVSGKAEIVSYTVNHMPWIPDLEVPYVVAIVGLTEQQGLNITTEIININPDKVFIGMQVKVLFEQHEEIYLPLFEPLSVA